MKIRWIYVYCLGLDYRVYVLLKRFEKKKILSDRNRPHLLQRPILPHCLRLQLLDLVIQMLHQHLPPGVHLFLEDRQLQVDLAALAHEDVLVQLVHPLVDQLMLPQQLVALAGLELGHLLGQDGVEVGLLDGVVRLEVADQPEALVEELLEGHVLGAAGVDAGCVEGCPHSYKVVVLER